MTWRGRVAGNANLGDHQGDTAEEFHDMTICNLCCKQTTRSPLDFFWAPGTSVPWCRRCDTRRGLDLRICRLMVRLFEVIMVKLKQESLPSPIWPILWNHQIWVVYGGVLLLYKNIPFGEWPVGENDLRVRLDSATAEGRAMSKRCCSGCRSPRRGRGAERANGWILASDARKSRNMNLKNQ